MVLCNTPLKATLERQLESVIRWLAIASESNICALIDKITTEHQKTRSKGGLQRTNGREGPEIRFWSLGFRA